MGTVPKVVVVLVVLSFQSLSVSSKKSKKVEEYKVIVAGPGGVGKSALTVQYVQGVFVEKYDPTIEDSYRKVVDIDGVECVLNIVDTAGTEQFTASQDVLMRTGDGFLLVYSIIDEKTFENIGDLREKILRGKDRDDVPMILVGNKCDLDNERKVRRERGQEAVKEKWKNMLFIETSAKTKENVAEAFHNIVRHMRPTVAPKKDKKKSKCIIL